VRRKPQQKIPWADVWKKTGKETGREKNRFKIRDLFADERCTKPILDFLRTSRRTGLEQGREEEKVSEQEERGEPELWEEGEAEAQSKKRMKSRG
jgi:hypothetical protein